MALCNEHSGFNVKLNTLENNVRQLWKRWDWLQKIVLGIFITLSLNLLGILALLAKSYVKVN